MGSVRGAGFGSFWILDARFWILDAGFSADIARYLLFTGHGGGERRRRVASSSSKLAEIWPSASPRLPESDFRPNAPTVFGIEEQRPLAYYPPDVERHNIGSVAERLLDAGYFVHANPRGDEAFHYWLALSTAFG